MAEKNVTANAVYTYKAEPGFLLPVGVPSHDLTQQDIDRMQPSARREVKALAANGLFFEAVNKATATKAMNAAAHDAADAAEEGEA